MKKACRIFLGFISLWMLPLAALFIWAYNEDISYWEAIKSEYENWI